MRYAKLSALSAAEAKAAHHDRGGVAAFFAKMNVPDVRE